MRLLHLIHGLEIGGAERQLVTLVDAMRDHDLDQRVGLLQKRGSLAAEVEDMGVPVVEFRLRHRALFAGLGRLRSYLRRERIDVLHCHLHLPSVYGRMVAWTAGTPVRFWTEHSDVANRNMWGRIAERMLVPATSLKVTVSREQAENTVALEGFPADRILTLNNSVLVERFAPDEAARQRVRTECGFGAADVVLATLSNLHARKRVDGVLRCVRLLLDEGVSCRLMVVGDGVDRADLESLADALGLAGQVVFLGARHDVANVLQATDVLVSASRWEGLPISMLETLASSRPIVSTAVGGVPDLIAASGAGRTVPADRPERLTDPLRELIGDADLRTELGRRGHEYVGRHHNADENARILVNLYRSARQGPIRITA